MLKEKVAAGLATLLHIHSKKKISLCSIFFGKPQTRFVSVNHSISEYALYRNVPKTSIPFSLSQIKKKKFVLSKPFKQHR